MPSLETYYLRETFGDMTPDGRPMDGLPNAEKIRLGKATLAIAAADGELSKTEFDHFMGMTMAFGAVPPEVIDELKKFDAKNAKIEELITPEMKPFARGFLYGAIKTARADGYHEKEKAATRVAAKILGIDEGVVQAMEALLDTEAAVRQMRLSLLFGGNKKH